MKPLILCTTLAALAFAADTDSPTGPRITPPILNSVSPAGLSRGMTTEVTVEGLNLAGASAVYFSRPGIQGRVLRVKELPDLPDIRLGANGTPSTVDVGPLPPRNQVTLEVDVASDAEIGVASLRLLTALGTSPEAKVLIEPYYGEAPDREPNDTPDTAFETYLPAILAGAISKAGDVDHYKIEVKAGDRLVFENGAAEIGSTLMPVVSIIAPDQAVVREVRPGEHNYFVHTFDKGGTYYVRIADYQRTGRASNVYRIKVGRFPLAISAYPLGLQRGKSREVALAGYNLAAKAVTVQGAPSDRDENALFLRPAGAGGPAFNEVKLAVGSEVEAEARSAGQTVTPAVTLNGRIAKPGDEASFRFHAGKGQKLVFEVNARRLGSELDSLLEIVDAQGRPVERAVARAVWDTYTTLNERDSVSRGIRIQAWNSLNVGDYVMIGGEILRLEALPKGPDDDAVFEGFAGQRIAFFDTSTEAHAVDKPVYKVQIHPAGAQFAPNGLPLVHLYYRNDDGGPGYGKDSLLRFTALADGDYTVRLRDVRGMGGDDYAYRLTIRPPKPDFRLSVNPRNPNVPVGGSVPLTVTAFRMDEFEGPIEVVLRDLPAGLHATGGVIGAGQVSTTVLLSADAGAKLPQAVELKVEGRATIAGTEVAHRANPEDRLKLIALMPQADIQMISQTKEVVLEPGGTAEVSVKVARQNNFAGRVPVEVRNLPPRVLVMDIGLNGVLINEDETQRTFKIEALSSAEPVEQLIWLSGAIETRSPQQNSYAATQPILLKVKPKTQVATAH